MSLPNELTTWRNTSRMHPPGAAAAPARYSPGSHQRRPALSAAARGCPGSFGTPEGFLEPPEENNQKEQALLSQTPGWKMNIPCDQIHASIFQGNRTTAGGTSESRHNKYSCTHRLTLVCNDRGLTHVAGHVNEGFLARLARTIAIDGKHGIPEYNSPDAAFSRLQKEGLEISAKLEHQKLKGAQRLSAQHVCQTAQKRSSQLQRPVADSPRLYIKPRLPLQNLPPLDSLVILVEKGNQTTQCHDSILVVWPLRFGASL